MELTQQTLGGTACRQSGSSSQPQTPNPSVMSLSIFEHGDGRFRLFRDEREVGWVEGRAIGFFGFDSQAIAVDAATAAYDALTGWLARQSGEQLTPRGRRRLRIRVENGEHQLTLGGAAIG